MNRFLRKGLVAVSGILLSGMISTLTVSGEEWTIYGARAQGMGGAGVATGDGATAHYWNPAAIKLNDKTGVYIPFGTTLSVEGDIMQEVTQIADKITTLTTPWSTLSTQINSGSGLTLTDTRQLLDLFVNEMPDLDQKGQGMLFNASTGVGITVGGLGIWGNYLTSVGVDPVVDQGARFAFSNGGGANAINDIVGAGSDRSGVFTNAGSQSLADTIFNAGLGFTQNQAEELVYQAELTGANTADPNVQSIVTSIAQATGTGTSNVTDNQSGLIFSGILVREIGVSYAHELMDGRLTIGGNLKMMEGQTYYNFIRFNALEQGSDIYNDLLDKKNTESSTSFGVDGGAIYKFTDLLKVGLTARNINTPKFDFDGPGDYKLKPQIRAGGAIQLSNILLLAADLDITKNESQALDGYESQMIGAGLEFRVPILAISLRGGMYKDLAADEGDALVYTAGLGLHVIALDIDIAAAKSTDTFSIENSKDVPQRIGVSFSAAVRF
ncbi:MAG: conjugal transfer protein TraF [Planctomycetota bacterium]